MDGHGPQTLLLFPPLAPGLLSPEIGLPQLMSFVRASGHPVRMADLNAEMIWDWLFRPDRLRRWLISENGRLLHGVRSLLGQLARERRRLERALGLDAEAPRTPRNVRLRVLLAQYLAQQEVLQPTSVDVCPDTEASTEETDRIVRALQESTELERLAITNFLSRAILPAPPTVHGVPEALHRTAPILDEFLSERLDPLLDQGPAIVGLSIHGTSQFLPALRIARRVRRSLPETRILLGGPWCRAAGELLMEHPSLLEDIDSVVLGEGEKPLLEWIRCVQKGGRPHRSRSVGESDQGPAWIVSSSPVPLARLPPLRFDGLPMDLYPTRIVPFRTLRGCYWSRCSFCAHVLVGDRSDSASPAPEPVIRSLLETVSEAVRRYDVRRLALANHATPPVHLRQIAEALDHSSLRVEWESMVRFDPAFDRGLFRRLADSGCTNLSFGLETSNPRTLRRFRKGLDQDRVLRCLEEATAAGIATTVFLLHMPPQPLEEYEESFDFVVRHHEIIHWVIPQRFVLGRRTRPWVAPHRLDIRIPETAWDSLKVFDLPYEAEGWTTWTDFQRATEEGFLRFISQKAGGPDGSDSRKPMEEVPPDGGTGRVGS